MEPRLESSNKWTALPKELLQDIVNIFKKTFAHKTKGGDFHSEGRIYGKELLFKVGYAEKGRLVHANFEVSIEFDPKKENALKLIHTSVDCAASMLDEYFKAESLSEFPKSWEKYDIDNKQVFLRCSTINKELEKEADRLLGIESDDTLVQQDMDDLEDKDSGEGQ